MPPKPHNERTFFKLLYTPAVFESTSRLSRFFGRGFCSFVARSVAWAYAVTQHGVRETVRRNLALLTARPARRRDAVAVFTNYGATIADYVLLRNMEPAAAAALCVESLGVEHLEAARRHGKGAILATGHYGFFEFGALLLGRMGYPVTVVTLSEPTRALTDWRAQFRRRWGAETIEVGPDAFSSLRVVEALNAGGFAAMLADRPMGGPTVTIDLPRGRLAFAAAPALLAYMADCPVIPVVIVRRADGGYRIVTKPCVWPRAFAGGREAGVEAATRAIAASLFEEIIREPRQWYQFVPVGL
ncbi:MAG: lysophospholipid acyltransferase family protein [Terrimicrobiaceae bacterium]|nr:lysophospholipid acyltransferase family protein [Terrimicrobiaceae bacterium]